MRRRPLRLPVLRGGHPHSGTFPAGVLASKNGTNAPPRGAVCHRAGTQRLSQDRGVRITAQRGHTHKPQQHFGLFALLLLLSFPGSTQ